METSKLVDMESCVWPFIEFSEGDKQRRVARVALRAADL